MQEDIDASITNSALRPKPSDCKVTADHIHASWEEVKRLIIIICDLKIYS